MAAVTDPDPRRLVRRSHVVRLAIALAVVATLSVPGPACAAPTLRLEALVGGRPVASSTEHRPLVVSPRLPMPVELTVTNSGSSAVQVRTVRLDGKVMGLTFFAYETSVNLNVPAGTTVTRTFNLDLAGLSGQATGLIRGSISLLDQGRHQVAAQRLVVDVRGSLRSVYGFFGLTVALLTAISLIGVFVALARHRLPTNRWRRAERFLPGGVGLGLVLIFTLSALRVFAPQLSRSFLLLLLSSAAFFVLGYFTPTPDPPTLASTPAEEGTALLADVDRPTTEGPPTPGTVWEPSDSSPS